MFIAIIIIITYMYISRTKSISSRLKCMVIVCSHTQVDTCMHEMLVEYSQNMSID